jgi:hypothetical protein
VSQKYENVERKVDKTTPKETPQDKMYGKIT